jgi:hypothetical protein
MKLPGHIGLLSLAISETKKKATNRVAMVAAGLHLNSESHAGTTCRVANQNAGNGDRLGVRLQGEIGSRGVERHK